MNLRWIFACRESRPPASRFICFPSLRFVSRKKHEKDDEAKFGSCLIIHHRRLRPLALLTRRFLQALAFEAGFDECRCSCPLQTLAVRCHAARLTTKSILESQRNSSNNRHRMQIGRVVVAKRLKSKQARKFIDLLASRLRASTLVVIEPLRANCSRQSEHASIMQTRELVADGFRMTG